MLPRWCAWGMRKHWGMPLVRQAAALRSFHATRLLCGLPSQKYQSLVQEGEVEEDPCQLMALEKLDVLYKDLETFTKEGMKEPDPPASKGFFGSLFGSASAAPVNDASESKKSLSKLKGVYLYGGVGCGKSFLMDLFYNEVTGIKKKRVHFNQFMLGVHQGIHKYKRLDRSTDGITQVVRDLAAETDLLCFDEVQVTDIADAMILRRLFSALYNEGLVVVATSNRAPGELYRGGLNREIFLPFIALLKERCEIHDMAAHTDYRTTGDKLTGFYFTPVNKATRAKLLHTWKRVCIDKENPRELTVFGRPLKVNKASGHMAWFTFNDLCAQALGAADYQALSCEFHTLFLENIPTLNLNLKAEIRRLILLVDELYEHKVKLFATAAADPSHLLHLSEGGSESNHGELMDALNAHPDMFNGQEEKFAFARCISRLQEMQSRQYLELPHTVLGRPEYIDRLISIESPAETTPSFVQATNPGHPARSHRAEAIAQHA